MKKAKKVKAVYVGQRVLNRTKLAAAFKIEGEPELRYFSKVKFCEIGREYFLSKDGEGYYTEAMPEAVDDEKQIEESKQIRAWAAQECDARFQVRKLKTRMAASKNEELRSIANRLRAYCEGMTYVELCSVVNFLIEEASKEK